MATKQNSTVVGVFEDRVQADRAVRDLKAAGFRDDQIGVVTRHDEGEFTTTDGGGHGSHAGEGAVAGVLAGAGLGGLVGLGILAGMIPVIGPVVAGGTLGVILANAAGGAAIAGLVGALVGAGVPEEDASYYEGEVTSGRTLVTVTADGRYDEATTILRRHGAYDRQTADTWAGERGTTARSATATGTGTSARTARGGETIEVREEVLEAHKRPVDRGDVRVRKEVVTEHKTIDVPVQHEEVVIERHAGSGRASTSDIRQGEEIRIPVTGEDVSVDKHAVVREEVTVGKRVVSGTERVSGDVRKEQVRVEQTGKVDVRDETKSGKRSS